MCQKARNGALTPICVYGRVWIDTRLASSPGVRVTFHCVTNECGPLFIDQAEVAGMMKNKLSDITKKPIQRLPYGPLFFGTHIKNKIAVSIADKSLVAE